MEGRRGQRGVLAGGERDVGLEDRAAAVHRDDVGAGLEPELDRVAGRLAQLGDQRAVRLAHGDAPAQLGGQHQARLRAAHVGDDHVAGAGEVELVGGVLRPGLRALRARQRLLRRELIRLLQRDALVLVDVGGAAQARHQVVGEVRGGDAVRLLRPLVGGAGGEERVAAHVGRRVHQERRPLHAALAARERARRARIEDHDAQLGGRLLDARAQLVVADAIAADQQPVLVGVAGVIDQQLAADAGRGAGAQPLLDVRERRVEGGAVGGRHEHDVLGRDAAHRLQHAAHRARVGGRVAQLGARRAAVVDARQQHEAAQAHGRRRRRPGRGGRGARGPHQHQADQKQQEQRREDGGKRISGGHGSSFLAACVLSSESEICSKSGRQRQRLPARRRLSRESAGGLGGGGDRKRLGRAHQEEALEGGRVVQLVRGGQADFARRLQRGGGAVRLLGPVQRHLAGAVDRQQHAVAAAAAAIGELDQIAARGAGAVRQRLVCGGAVAIDEEARRGGGRPAP